MQLIDCVREMGALRKKSFEFNGTDTEDEFRKAMKKQKYFLDVANQCLPPESKVNLCDSSAKIGNTFVFQGAVYALISGAAPSFPQENGVPTEKNKLCSICEKVLHKITALLLWLPHKKIFYIAGGCVIAAVLALMVLYLQFYEDNSFGNN